MRNELNQLAEAGHAHEHEQDARHEPCGEQARKAIARHDWGKHNHERGGGTGDLELGATRHGHDRASHDGSVKAVLRRHADSDGKRHRQRQSHDAHDEACQGVGAEVGDAVALGERLAQRRRHRKVERHARTLWKARKERFAFGHMTLEGASIAPRFPKGQGPRGLANPR